MNINNRCLVLFISGFLTVIMQLFVPIGGGVSLIFVLSVPILIVLGAILSAFYFYFLRELKSQKVKDISFYFMLGSMIYLAILFYPYS